MRCPVARVQVDGVVNENEGLRGALSRALEGRSLAALASHHDGGGHARSGALMAEEASLLKEENTLLAEAQVWPGCVCVVARPQLWSLSGCDASPPQLAPKAS